MQLRVASLVVLLSFLLACDPPEPSDAGVEPPVILEVRAPTPALEGSILEVRALGLEVYGAPPQLAVLQGETTIAQLETAADDDPLEGTVRFELSREVVSTLGGGIHPLAVQLRGAGPESAPFMLELRLVTTLEVDLFDVPNGEVFRNQVGVLRGAGFVSATEGAITARFVGTFTPDAGGGGPIDVALPVAPLERGDRERGVVVLGTALGGLMPGVLDGTVQLRSTLRSGETSESAALPTQLRFTPPALFGLAPTEAALGQILRVSGGGFLGGDDGGTTLLRLEGAFTPEGGVAQPFGPVERVPRFVSGAEVQLVVEFEVDGDRLVSADFGHARGRFEGMATPITQLDGEQLEGDPVPFGFRLGALRQIVHLRFLPGFYDSLRRFGLASAAPEVVARVKERIEGIFQGWNVEVRLDTPDDFARSAYSVLEIGGPDPNGLGLFGYDNSPGKDVGNLRLDDQIGGANAQTQSDGHPGYGGVFVDSFLYWSMDPGFDGERPVGAPDPDPLFDEVFGPVRTEPARRAEVAGAGDADRVAKVKRAVRALGSIIGETAAHEIGHSLGMAQPYGPPTAYHNEFDADGCLMDTGSWRPLGERMDESGYASTHICHEQPAYLSEILGP